MKEVKIQIRVAVETREEWKRLASASHKTLTQYIVDKVEGSSNEPSEASGPSEPIKETKVAVVVPEKEWRGSFFKSGSNFR